jgi:hypothetical protein
VLTSVDGVNVETKPGLSAILDERRGDDRAMVAVDARRGGRDRP